MKNLITTVACLIILLVIMLQFSVNQATNAHLTAADKAVAGFNQEIRIEGGISEEKQSALQEKMAKILGCKAEEVKLTGKGEGALVPGPGEVPRGEFIYYTLSIPLKDVIAAAEFWNLADTEKDQRKTYKEACASEYIDHTQQW
ncbi:MAG: hypothetical protein RR661_05760 [Anaerovoracaceae bacterium]